MTDAEKNSGSNKRKLIVLFVFVVTAVFISLKYDVRSFSPESIRDGIIAFGVWAPIVFIMIYTLRPLVLFPSSVFSLAGGLAFGTWLGGLYNYIGAVLSAILAFMIARHLGREYVRRIMKGKLHKFEELMGREGFSIVFYLRFFAPFDPLSYAAGLSKISFRDYLVATMIPIIPATFAFSNFGNSFSKIKSINDLLSTEFILPLIILIGAMLIPLVVKKIAKKRETG